MRNLALVYFQGGDLQKGLDAGKAYLAKFGDDVDILAYMSDAAYTLKDYAGAAEYAGKSVHDADASGKKPDEEVLKIWLVASSKLNNKPDYFAALDELVVDYPSTDVWHDALMSVPSRPGFSTKYVLDVDILKFAAGTMRSADDFVGMADAALKANLPAYAKAAMDAAFEKKVVSDAGAKQLQATANTRAAKEKLDACRRGRCEGPEDG